MLQLSAPVVEAPVEIVVSFMLFFMRQRVYVDVPEYRSMGGPARGISFFARERRQTADVNPTFVHVRGHTLTNVETGSSGRLSRKNSNIYAT